MLLIALSVFPFFAAINTLLFCLSSFTRSSIESDRFFSVILSLV